MYSSVRKTVSIIVLVTFAAWPLRGYCLPTGEQVVEGSGSAAFDRSTANTLNINQGTERVIINYDSFSIAQPETVRFLQPSAASIALNRVIGVDPSILLGTLTANGRIFLVNPNGVLFGAGARVDAAGLVASTLTIKDGDFLAGRYTFFGAGGSVVNQGYIAAPGGYVALLGSNVLNAGVIEANLGSIALAGGQAMTLGLDPKGMINVVVDEASLSNAAGAEDCVKNSGTLKAGAGKVVLTAKTLDSVFKKAVNTTGIIEADSIDAATGAIVVRANNRVNIGGSISAKKGTVDVDVQGADFSASITAGQAAYKMNDGHTTIASGTYIGNQAWSDNEHIFIPGEVTVNGDYVTITADADHDNSGDLTIDGGVLALNGKSIGLNAENLIFNNALVSVTAASGDAFVLGNAGGSISMTDSMVAATVNGNGDALVQFTADGSIDLLGSTDLISTVNGSKLTGGWTNIYLESRSGPITLNGGSAYMSGDTLFQPLTRLQSSVNGGNSVIYVKAGGKEGISMTNAGIVNFCNGSGWTETYVEASNGRLNFDNLHLDASIGYGDVQTDFKAARDIEVAHSFINSYTGSGDSDMYFSSRTGGVAITGGSEVTSEVGYSGLAAIYFKNNDSSTVWYAPILGIFGSGSLKTSDPLLGDIVIDKDSSLLAKVGTGAAPATAYIYMNTNGNIVVDDTSTVVAQENMGNAGVVMIAGKNITTAAGSLVRAESRERMAGVAMLAGGSIDAQGEVIADAGSGTAAVALVAAEDVTAAKVSAVGESDGVGYLEQLIEKEFCLPVDIGLVPFSSAVVLGSLVGNVIMGNIAADVVLAVAAGIDDWFSEDDDAAGYGGIFSTGLVKAKWLAMLARNDIGTVDAPIKTKIDTLSAYSYDKGGIYIDEADDLEVGTIIPVYADSEVPMEIGMSVAANDGIVHIVSGNAMLVNSIIAPNGGVYLESREGSIFAGRGWDPGVDENDIENAGELAAFAYTTLMEDEADPKFFTILIRDAMMELGDGYYYTPVQVYSSLSAGPNVIAGGYSYFYTPNGRIGVGSVYDSGFNPDLSGEVRGIVRPSTDSYSFADPTVGLDPERMPSRGVFYDEDGVGVQQVYPDPVGPEGEVIAPEMSNPLRVDIRVREGAVSAAPAGFVPQAGLTLAFGSTAPIIRPVSTAQYLVQPFKTISVYYEQNNGRNFSSPNMGSAFTLLGYRPLVSANMAAFDAMALDAGAYDFISNNINLKKSLAPFFGQMDEDKKKQH